MSNTDNLSGKTLGTCTLERLLGQGGMGAVYLAKQTRPARNVAVKVLFPNLAPNSEVYQEFLVRFRREADIVARLEHVNIMPIYEYGEESGLAYLVMPYLSGGSLRDVLARRGALPLSEVIKYTEQAASALDYAHRQGVVHRDLKPANFLLHADGRLVLADFGIARIMEGNAASGATLTSTGTILGTPEYMAPEMAQGETIDFRADIYELGIVIFQLLSGHVPFAGNTPYAVAIQHIQEPLPSLRRMNPAIPAAVDAVLQKATSKHREERYTTVSEMAEALRRAQFASSPATARQSSNQEDQFPTVAASPPPPPSGSGRKNIQTPPHHHRHKPDIMVSRDSMAIPIPHKAAIRLPTSVAISRALIRLYPPVLSGGPGGYSLAYSSPSCSSSVELS
ncbi:serine/threonine protein kinase [Ktedonosporobacter rubrisoli]|uniref:non-specific serine/threonine protein kinase n=1 Tax=Ktedonosporobacter rubrisoli TaxID=2509675 RepID=A0A4P6JR67_KTERU|nr:serine/threonine-protein kinase [Ktedonosporobacter rubrisoli]QBD77937.1 serine/threonine protein kinase [Ktedonosporobacter rubrisoli]